jgi:hypothetical protein
MHRLKAIKSSWQSLNHQEPLCGPPFPQVPLDRKGQSYRFCFDAVMRSLPSAVVAAVRVVGPQRHRGVGGRADRPPSTSIREVGFPRPGNALMKASGPGGGRGRTRYSMSNDQPSTPPPVPGPLLIIGRLGSGASPVGVSRMLTERPSANWTRSAAAHPKAARPPAGRGCPSPGTATAPPCTGGDQAPAHPQHEREPVRIPTDVGQRHHGVVGSGQQQRHRGHAREHVHPLPPPHRVHQLKRVTRAGWSKKLTAACYGRNRP